MYINRPSKPVISLSFFIDTNLVETFKYQKKLPHMNLTNELIS